MITTAAIPVIVTVAMFTVLAFALGFAVGTARTAQQYEARIRAMRGSLVLEFNRIKKRR